MSYLLWAWYSSDDLGFRTFLSVVGAVPLLQLNIEDDTT
jgi:hypothetical protein